MRTTRPIAIVTVLLLVASVAAVPGAVSATSHLSTTVEQDAHGAVTVTVNGSDGPLSGATVNVTPADPANDSYAGSGEYTTDANGTVPLPAPAADVSVVVAATNGSDTVSATVLLHEPTLDVAVAQDPETANATASVTYAITGAATDGATVNVTPSDPNDSYAGAGTYTADANGTVDLPAPAEPVQVDVEATAGNLSGGLTTTLQNASALSDDEEDAENFGARVSAFVHELFGDDVQVPWIGRTVADFVVENNPGNAPDHAGPKEDTGPPAHAGPPGDDDSADATAAASAGDDSDDDVHADRGPDGDRGPPEKAVRPDDDRDDDDDSPTADDGDDADDEEDGDDAEDGDDDGSAAAGGGNGGSNAGGNGKAKGNGR